MTSKLHSVTARLRRIVTMTLATLLIVCALVVGIGRELVKEIERFHAPLEQWLSEKTALEIRFGEVRGRWTTASPEFRFSNLTVRNPAVVDAPPLRVAQLAVRLSLTNTLTSGSPRLRLRMSGAEAHLKRRDDGFWLLGKPLQGKPTAEKQNPLRWLLNKPRVSIYDSRLYVDGVYERRADALISHLKLYWRQQNAFLDADATLRGPDEIKVSVKSDLTLYSRNGGEVQGASYIALSEGHLMRWLPPALRSSFPVALDGAHGKTELWLHWFKNRLMSSTLRFDWRDTQIIPTGEQAQSFDRIAGTARWQGRWEEFWQLGLRNVLVEGGGSTWRPSTLQLNALYEQVSGRWNYDVALADASFSLAKPMLSLLPLNSSWRDALGQMAPSGRVQDMYAKLRRDQSGWSLLKAQGQLQGYSQHPWQAVPGVDNLGVAFWWDQQQLILDFDQKAVVLDYPALFRGPLALEGIRGSLKLQVEPDTIRLRSSPLLISTPHGTTHTRLSLILPRKGATVPGTLALQSTLRGVDAQFASLYLPAAIIPEKLLAWLDGALKGGTLVQGDIVFNGPLQRPELEAGRTVLLGFKVDDGVLQFLPEWQEPVKKLSADVIVENGRVQATVEKGEYYGLSLGASQVWTQRQGDVPHLHVVTLGKGQASDGLRVLRESPLGKTLREPLSDLSLQGPLTLAFQLDAPLVAQGVLAGKTSVSLDNATLKWPSTRLMADKLALAVEYDVQKGLSSQKLQARLLDGTVVGKLYQQREGKARILRLDLQGTTPATTLRDWLDMPQLGLATGTAPYRVAMYLRPREAQRDSQLEVTSSLKGVTIDLPAPFGKSSETTQEFIYRQRLASTDRTHEAILQDILSVSWETRNGQWRRGGIRVGTGQAVFSSTHPWRLTGHLSRFRWSEWSPTVERLKAMGNASNRGNFSWLSTLGDSRLSLDQLYLGDEDFGSVVLSLHSDEHYVALSSEGERVKGRLTLPRTFLDAPSQRSLDTPIALYIQKLVLAPAEDTDAPADPALDVLPPSPTFDPRLLPSAHVRIDQLWAGNDDRGSYQMTLQPIPEGVQADNVRMRLKHVDFTGTVRWEQKGNDARTYFKGKGVAENAADVLTGWGYTPSIDSKSALLDMDVQWLGAPYQFKLARTQGSLNANLKNGHFLKVSNNAAGRVWGLLNFETWMSRLQLRFDDLSDSEMTFKEIRGRFALGNNQVQVNRLRIDSSSLKMRMEGVVDMSERQLNMQWFVTVPVTRNLLLPAAVVGGLPGAATAYVIDKVLSTQIDKLTTLTYDVRGTFDQPQATLRIPLQ